MHSCETVKQLQGHILPAPWWPPPDGPETQYVQNQNLVAQIDGQITHMFQTTLGASKAYFLDPQRNQ